MPLLTYADVGELITFIRTPTWITPGYAQDKAGPGGSNFESKRSIDLFTTKQLMFAPASSEQRDLFRKDPAKYMEYRKDIENELNRRFKFVSSLVLIAKLALLTSERLLRIAESKWKPSSSLLMK
jgi:hypothetical protein